MLNIILIIAYIPASQPNSRVVAKFFSEGIPLFRDLLACLEASVINLLHAKCDWIYRIQRS